MERTRGKAVIYLKVNSGLGKNLKAWEIMILFFWVDGWHSQQRTEPLPIVTHPPLLYVKERVWRGQLKPGNWLVRGETPEAKLAKRVTAPYSIQNLFTQDGKSALIWKSVFLQTKKKSLKTIKEWLENFFFLLNNCHQPEEKCLECHMSLPLLFGSQNWRWVCCLAWFYPITPHTDVFMVTIMRF